MLMRQIINQAIDIYNVNDMNFLADNSKGFPFNWYKKIGMGDSSWVFMSGEPNEVLGNLNKQGEKHDTISE